jgi:hypothetical protein
MADVLEQMAADRVQDIIDELIWKIVQERRSSITEIEDD